MVSKDKSNAQTKQLTRQTYQQQLHPKQSNENKRHLYSFSVHSMRCSECVLI